MSKKPVVLMILDGYGLNDNCEHNAVCEGKTPVMDQLMSQCPFVKGQASGLAVGLPEGQMGNSEVGHLNMGAGRVVYQELTRITKAILGDEHSVLTVSAMLRGDYGQRDIYTGVPCIINQNGVQRVLELSLSEQEMEKFGKSCKTLRESFEGIV